MRSRVRCEHFLERKARKIFFRHSALDKSSKGYGIGHSLHLIYLFSFISIFYELSVTFSDLTPLTNILPLELLTIYCAFFCSPQISKAQFGRIHFQSSVSTIFFKMAGTALIYDFHHNTYSKTICSCFKTFGSFIFTLLFSKLYKLQQFHHLLPTPDEFILTF